MAMRILSSFGVTEQCQSTFQASKISSINPAFAAILRDRRHRGNFRAFNTTELSLILSDPLRPDSAKLVLLLVAHLTYWSVSGTRKLVSNRLSLALGETLSANAITKHLRRLRDLGYLETTLTPTQSLQVTYCLPIHYWTVLDEAPLRQPYLLRHCPPKSG